MSPDIYVTGIGMVSPAGVNAETTWAALLAGQRFVTEWAAGGSYGLNGLPVALVEGFSPPAGAEKTDRASQFAVAAAIEAKRSAALAGDSAALLAFGSSKIFLELSALHRTPSRKNTADTAVAHGDSLLVTNPHSGVPFSLPAVMKSSMAHASVAACATGTLNVIRAAQAIADGDADLAICGGTDASIHPLWMACYVRMGVLGRPDPRLGPAWACRPFDRTRSGFAVGEGAAALVLESGKAIARRQTRALARVLGYATGTDPAGLTQLSADGGPLAYVIRAACRKAGIEPGDLVCVHAHGTGTPANDVIEARAIRATLGPAAERVPIVSTKGAIGHLLGAAGAIELGFAALTCRDGRCPGNVTLTEPDPQLEGLCLPREAFDVAKGPVLKTSLGFGGHLAAVVLGPA